MPIHFLPDPLFYYSIDPPLASFMEKQNCNCLNCPGKRRSKESVTLSEMTGLLPALIISDFLPTSSKKSPPVYVKISKEHSFSHVFCVVSVLSILSRLARLEMWKMAQF